MEGEDVFIFQNLIPIRLLPVSSVKGFQSKMELEDTKCSISCISYLRRMELRNWETDLFLLNAWFTEDWDLSPDQWTSAKNPSLPSSQWTYCLNSGWTSPFARLVHKYSLPQTFNGFACSFRQHTFPKLQFLCRSWIGSISRHLSMPHFVSLFRLTSTMRVQNQACTFSTRIKLATPIVVLLGNAHS